MAFAEIGAIRLYYEEHGAGEPLVLSHEFAGSVKSWEPQLELSRSYRLVLYNSRGYPPSTVPADPAE